MKHIDDIERLCELQADVYAHIDPNGDDAADCFCGKGGFWGSKYYGPNNYRNAGKCIDYIVLAVHEKILREKESTK